eukprot:g6601.t1
MSKFTDPDSENQWRDTLNERQNSGVDEDFPVAKEEELPKELLSSFQALTVSQDEDKSSVRTRQTAPPRLDKTHGFMKFIIQNQNSRKDYEEKQAALKLRREIDEDDNDDSPKRNKLNRQRKEVRVRPGFESYKPPHARKVQQ